MALTSGTRLGVYEVIASIGAGGMGEVFRARDTKLNRDVALKVLPDSFASDADRLARFTREAQTLAAINHPNIAHIHGFEESGGVRAIVMELVEAVDVRDVRVIDGRQCLCFAREPREPIGIAGERVGQDFQRDVAIELRIARAEYLAHPARADAGDDFVDAETRAGN